MEASSVASAPEAASRLTSPRSEPGPEVERTRSMTSAEHMHEPKRRSLYCDARRPASLPWVTHPVILQP